MTGHLASSKEYLVKTTKDTLVTDAWQSRNRNGSLVTDTDQKCDTTQDRTQERTQIGVDRLGETSTRRTRAQEILRSTRGTGRPTREVPNGCQPVGAQCTARHGTRADTRADTDGGGPARRDLRAPHTCSADPRSTRGTGRPARGTPRPLVGGSLVALPLPTSLVTAPTAAGIEDDPTRCPRLRRGRTESASMRCTGLCVRSRVIWLY